MAKAFAEFQNVGSALKNTAKSVAGSGKGFIDAFKGTGAPAAAASESVLTKVVFWPFKKAAKVAAWGIEQPIAYGLKAVKWGVNGVGTAYRKAPILMVPLTIIGGASLISGGMRRRAEARTQAQNEQQMAMIEAQMQQPQAPLAQVNTTYAPAADASFPEQGTAMNAASPQLMAGNDNLQHQGMVNAQQRVAAL
jgi:hypothetical protein